jgi:PAS domain S-box-containing protein
MAVIFAMPNDPPGSGDSGASGESHTRAADDLHRLLVERIRDYAIFALDAQGCVQTWNAGAERLTGYTASEITGEHLSVFYLADDLASRKPAKHLLEARTVGSVKDEGWRKRKDGTTFWAELSITVMRTTGSPELVGYGVVARDMTELHRAEHDLRASEDRFRLMVDSVKDYAIFMLDPTGHVATWNAGAQRIKGYTAAEIIGKHFSIFYPADEAEIKPDTELAIALSTGRYEEEGWRIRKDGSRFMASVIISPVRTSEGLLAGFSKVTRDLTERRAAQDRAIATARQLAVEEAGRAAAESRAKELAALASQLSAQAAELAQQRRVAETANRVKGEFLAAMSHELRTPLNAIAGYAQLMQMGIGGAVSDEQHRHLDRIQRSQQHLLGIINDILNFSRIEAGQLEYSIERVNVCDAIEAGAAMIAPQALERGIEVTTGATDSSLTVMADQAKLEQVLLNLLSNAIKFTSSGGVIELKGWLKDDAVFVSVRDTGTGISAENVERIFSPFMQVGRSLANPKEGTGLGLAISRDLARAMGGDLTAVSEEGVGSTFTLKLPTGEEE